MPAKVFMPYAFKDESLDIKVIGLTLDGRKTELFELVDSENLQVILHTEQHWAIVELDFEISDPNVGLPEVIGSSELVEDVLSVGLVLGDKSGRFRYSSGTVRRADGCWTGTIRVSSDDHFGGIRMHAVAWRKAAGGGTGLATRCHERVADSAPWTIYVDEKPPMPGGALDGQWCDFASVPNPILNNKANCAWHMDLSDSRRPTLYLNEGIEGLKTALGAPAVSGRKAHVRDVLAHSILQPVLASVISYCIEQHRELDYEKLENNWQKSVLETMASKVGDMSMGEKIDDWLKSWNEGQHDKVHADISTAVQVHTSMPQTASQLVKSLVG